MKFSTATAATANAIKCRKTGAIFTTHPVKYGQISFDCSGPGLPSDGFVSVDDSSTGMFRFGREAFLFCDLIFIEEASAEVVAEVASLVAGEVITVCFPGVATEATFETRSRNKEMIVVNMNGERRAVMVREYMPKLATLASKVFDRHTKAGYLVLVSCKERDELLAAIKAAGIKPEFGGLGRYQTYKFPSLIPGVHFDFTARFIRGRKTASCLQGVFNGGGYRFTQPTDRSVKGAVESEAFLEACRLSLGGR